MFNDYVIYHPHVQVFAYCRFHPPSPERAPGFWRLYLVFLCFSHFCTLFVPPVQSHHVITLHLQKDAKLASRLALNVGDHSALRSQGRAWCDAWLAVTVTTASALKFDPPVHVQARLPFSFHSASTSPSMYVSTSASLAAM